MTHTDTQPLLLIVDDDPGIRALLSRYLGQQGYRVAAVGDGVARDQWLERRKMGTERWGSRKMGVRSRFEACLFAIATSAPSLCVQSCRWS